MIESIEFENFYSFRSKQRLPLHEQGLVLIRGENRISNAADANGVGKSAIFHALSWGLFGQTLSGLRTDSVACRFTTSPCLVTVTLSDGEIVRGRRPGLFRVIPKKGQEIVDAKEAQAWIDDRLGFGVKTFTNAVVFTQGNLERFVQADQDEQLRMLDEIQGVDLRVPLQRAKAWRDTVLRDVAEVREGLRRTEALRESAHKALEYWMKAREVYREELDLLVEKLAKERQEITKSLALVRREIGVGKTIISDEKKYNAELESVTRTVDSAAVAARLAEAEVKRYRIQSKEIREKVENLIGLGSCPTCRQPVDAKRIGSHFHLDEEKSQTLLSKAELKLKGLLNTEKEALTLFENLRRKRSNIKLPNLESLTFSLGKLESRLDAIHQEELKTKLPWSGGDTLVAEGVRVKAAEAEYKNFAERLPRVERTLRVAEYWVTAFGDRGIRSLLIDSVAGFLQGRVAKHLELLAGGEAKAIVSAQTTKKDGSLRERFSLLVDWAWGGVSGGQASAGQDRRMDLAVFAALQDVAESRISRPFSLKVFDEAADALDARGTECFGEWIRGQARARGSAFLITHNTALSSMIVPDREWVVVLDKEGSRVVL